MAENEGMLSKIRALLAHAENEGNTEEARQSYMAKAMTLLAKYGIDRTMVDASKPRTEAVEVLEVRFVAPYTYEKGRLLGAVGSAYPARIIQWVRRGNPVKAQVVGFASDLEQIEMLYTSLLLQMVSGLSKANAPSGFYSNTDLTVWRRSWQRGFASEVGTRLRAARAETAKEYDRAHSDGPGTDLVLVDRKAAVESRYDEMFPDATNARKRKRQLNGGFHDGRAEGKRADIGGGKIGNQRAQIGG